MATKNLYAQNQEETAKILWTCNEKSVAWETEPSQGLLRTKGTQDGSEPPTCSACVNR